MGPVARLLAPLIREVKAAQAAALAGGALVHLVKPLANCEHGLTTNGDDCLLHCCTALAALLQGHTQAQVLFTMPVLQIRGCVQLHWTPSPSYTGLFQRRGTTHWPANANTASHS